MKQFELWVVRNKDRDRLKSIFEFKIRYIENEEKYEWIKKITSFECEVAESE